jgi:hypothetical protein
MSKNSFSVMKIPSQETYEWLLKKHYAHRIPSISCAFGLYENNILLGVCTFGMPASRPLIKGVCGGKYMDKIIELNRLVVESEETNITSGFLSRCLNMMSNYIVISYADTEQGHIGKIYQACNFIFTGTTKQRTDIGLNDGKHCRHYDKNIDYKINRVNRSQKHRYIYFCGDKRFKREAIKVLKYPVEPYPKGDTKRYDASYKPIVQGILF